MSFFKFFTRRKARGSSGSSTQQAPKVEPQDGAGGPPASGSDKIDILFLQDTTGSQGPYIHSATKAIRKICQKISDTANISSENIRFGLIAFRDHPPQDTTYVTKNFGFTTTISTMRENLKSLKASGGGDGPEAQTAALAEALNMEWEEDAAKMVVLITDSPPHGIGEKGDGFDSSPDQNDPLDIARQMAERGITLFVVACEPALSRYKNAVDFYTALTEITSGKMFPLTLADRLGDYIAGTAVETLETEKLISEYSKDVVENVYGRSKPIEEVMDDVHAKLQARNYQMSSLKVENPYAPSTTAEQNVDSWKSSDKITDGRSVVSAIKGQRMREGYASGSKVPELTFASSSVGYAQSKRVVTQSVMRSSNVTSKGMTKRGS